MFDSTIFVVKTMILKKETSRRFGYARGKEKSRRNTLEAEPTSNRRACGTIPLSRKNTLPRESVFSFGLRHDTVFLIYRAVSDSREINRFAYSPNPRSDG